MAIGTNSQDLEQKRAVIRTFPKSHNDHNHLKIVLIRKYLGRKMWILNMIQADIWLFSEKYLAVKSEIV